MKSLKLLTLSLLLSFGASAQIGSWYIGGTVGFGSTKTEGFAPNNQPAQPKTVNSNWNFSPEFGTWLQDDIQLGIGLNINGSSTKVDDDKVISSSNFNPTVYGRYYWRTQTALSFFAGLNLQLITGGTTIYDGAPNGDDIKGKTSGFAGGVNAGIAYALNDRVGIMGQMGVAGFSNSKTTPDKENEDIYTKSSQAGLLLNTLGPVFNIGIYYTFLK